MNELEKIIFEILDKFELIDGIISNKKMRDVEHKKIKIKPLVLKEEKIFQFEYFFEKKVIHKNFNLEEAFENLIYMMNNLYKQGIFYCKEKDIQILISKKNKIKIIEKNPTKVIKENYLIHNRKKNYIIKEDEFCDFLYYLGIMDNSGKVKSKKYDKFRQINKYLEIVSDCIPKLNDKEKIRIVDFGCGKAYLTFALYYYFVNKLNYNVEIIGLDLKKDVIDECNLIAKELEYNNLQFIVGDIKEYITDKKINMVISLHACDIATDWSIVKAINWDSDVILAVPCCQHEFNGKIKKNNIKVIQKHGILQERLSSILTDGLRANVMEIMGYKTDIFEFIDMEHTPKNLVIRGFNRGIFYKDDIIEYINFKKCWNMKPEIEDIIGDDFKKRVKKI